MVASRQDAWTEDDDLVLAEVTLRHIREGGTQLAAFEEVGQRLGRTAAACGFRWNSAVRKRYDAAIAIAKSQRQQLKKIGRLPAQTEFASEEALPQSISQPAVVPAAAAASGDEEQQIDAAIRLLTSHRETIRRVKQLEREIENKDLELKELREANNKLKKELENIQGVNEDYKALLQIMERARKLAFLKEEETAKPVFKMDSNGNLERIE
jgi:prespore-specific regulator